MEENKVYEIAILGRAVWQLHSLNNEGTVGNVTEPRSVRIIDPNTKKAVSTDGISGEMLKHIHTEIMWELSDKNNLCNACKVLNPEKFNASQNKGNSGEQAVKNALQSCDICDVHGFLITRPQVNRKSVIEFGWALGIPEVYRDIHTHARHSGAMRGIEDQLNPGEWGNERCQYKGCDTNPEDSPLYKIDGKWYCEAHAPISQMVYHRPTRSGVYAVISVFQPWRIGLNEAKTNKYSYDARETERKRRYQTALKAYQVLFARPEGAMTTTRLPHVEDFSGVIVYSTKSLPVPVISPLKEDYISEIETIANSIDNDLKIIKFSSIAEFAREIKTLMDAKPYKIEIK